LGILPVSRFHYEDIGFRRRIYTSLSTQLLQSGCSIHGIQLSDNNILRYVVKQREWCVVGYKAAFLTAERKQLFNEVSRGVMRGGSANSWGVFKGQQVVLWKFYWWWQPTRTRMLSPGQLEMGLPRKRTSMLHRKCIETV